MTKFTGTCLACLFAADLQVSSLTRICPNSASLRSGQIQEKTTVKEIVPRFSYCKAKPWQLFCFRSHSKNLAERSCEAVEFAKFVPSDLQASTFTDKVSKTTGETPVA